MHATVHLIQKGHRVHYFELVLVVIQVIATAALQTMHTMHVFICSSYVSCPVPLFPAPTLHTTQAQRTLTATGTSSS